MSGAPRRSRSFDQVRLAHDSDTGVEAIRARFGGHAYDLHRHDEWLVGVTESGLQQFFCRGARQRSTPGRVILIEPGEAHDGEAGTSDGFAYSMLYVPQPRLRQALADAAGGDPSFRTTLVDDDALGRAICRTSRLIIGRGGRLARDAAVDRVLELLRRHLGRAAREPSKGRAPLVARRARERLHDALGEEIGADDLAAAAGAASRFQLARAFRAAYGTAPHAYLVQIRLVEARGLLAAGEPPAQVAAQCGFADQSHLGRWFRRAYGMTPAAYRACCTGVPDGAAAIG